MKTIIFLLLSLFFNVSTSYGLEVDEKLSLRMLKVSDSKKTVLINRGVEDGLVVGDQARFFLTSGVVARGVLIKSSPSRSVWSLYRISKASEVRGDNPMNLKIIPPAKLTNDPTKMLKARDTSRNIPKGVVIAPGANNLEGKLTASEEKDLAALGKSTKEIAHLSVRNYELWGLIHLNLMQSNNSTGASGQGTSGGLKVLDVTLGFERYFLDTTKWYSPISFYPFFQMINQESTNVGGNTVSTNVTGYGAGINYHFKYSPLYVGAFIYYLGASFGLGSVSDTASLGEGTVSSNNTVGELSGKFTSFTVGGGGKYYISKGFGLRILLDYYQRSESYTVEGNDNFTKVVNGPRILLGLSYRW